MDCWIAFCGRIVMRPYDHFCGATVGAIHESPVSLPGPFLLRAFFKPPPEGEVAAGRKGGGAALYFTDSKPSVSGFESERKKEPMDMELSRTAEAE